MLRFDEIIDASAIPEWDSLASCHGREQVLMFDLETTGLTPKSAFIYIIGVNLWMDGAWHILQLFNDDGRSEPEMIRCFMDLCRDRSILFHFNGDTFDIPFVHGRMDKISHSLGERIPDAMGSLTSMDLLKEIRPFKYALGLPNVKQKTVEQYLGIHREDQYNGGQLIHVYLSFLSSGSRRNRDLVLLHNRDDMEGMFHLARMHALTALAGGEFTIGAPYMQEQGKLLSLTFPLSMNQRLPQPLVTTGCGTTLKGEDDHGSLTLPVYRMDAECRITKELSSGFFLPAFGYEGVTNYLDPEHRKVCLVAAGDSLLGDGDRLHSYISCVVQSLMKQNGGHKKNT